MILCLLHRENKLFRGVVWMVHGVWGNGCGFIFHVRVCALQETSVFELSHVFKVFWWGNIVCMVLV